MGKLRKIGKKIAGGFRKVGRKLKKGLGKLAKAFGKLGPLGSLALSFILPGIGSAIGSWLTTGPMGNFFTTIFNGISKAGKFLKDGVGTVFNRVTDAIEWGMNTVGGPSGTAGSTFRDFVSDATGGFIEKSTVGVESSARGLGLNPEDTLKAIDDGLTTADDIRLQGAKAREANPELYKKNLEAPKMPDAPKIPDTPKPSVLDKPLDPEATFRERVVGSKEYGAYKKIAPVQQFGAAINQQDEALAQYNASVAEQTSDYYQDFGQTILAQNYASPLQTAGSQQGFIDIAAFQQSDDIYGQWLQSIYGGISQANTPQQQALLAQQANPYGLQLTDIYA